MNRNDICQQFRSRWDVALCGFSSGSNQFVIQNISKTKKRYWLLKFWAHNNYSRQNIQPVKGYVTTDVMFVACSNYRNAKKAMRALSAKLFYLNIDKEGDILVLRWAFEWPLFSKNKSKMILKENNNRIQRTFLKLKLHFLAILICFLNQTLSCDHSKWSSRRCDSFECSQDKVWLK